MERLVISIPTSLKAKLDVQREQGTTSSGLIRWLLEQHFKQALAGKKGR